MKNLANCKPTEFIKQTNRLRKTLSKWMADIDLKEIRSRTPELEIVNDKMSKEEKLAVLRRNKQKVQEQGLKNLSEILDGALEKFPDETLEVLALFCFVEPKDVDKHSMSEYLASITELMNDEAVIGFFTSFLSLAQKSGLTA